MMRGRLPLKAAVPALRATAYVAAVVALFAFALARSVRADLSKQTLALGRQLEGMGHVDGLTHPVVLNGERLYVASDITDDSPNVVANRVEASCRERSGGLDEQFSALPSSVRTEVAQKFPTAWARRLGILRAGDDNEVSVLCIARRDGNGIADAVERLTQFATSGDVFSIGTLNYMYARRTDSGKTHMVSTHTEGPFNIYNIVGRGGGEAGGVDAPNAPRPLVSTRILSAQVESAMYGTYLFASPQASTEVLRFYNDRLTAIGWVPVVANAALRAQVWQREGVTMVVQANDAADGEGTLVSLSQARTTSPQLPSARRP